MLISNQHHAREFGFSSPTTEPRTCPHLHRHHRLLLLLLLRRGLRLVLQLWRGALAAAVQLAPLAAGHLQGQEARVGTRDFNT